jgi:hypothetical protein
LLEFCHQGFCHLGSTYVTDPHTYLSTYSIRSKDINKTGYVEHYTGCLQVHNLYMRYLLTSNVTLRIDYGIHSDRVGSDHLYSRKYVHIHMYVNAKLRVEKVTIRIFFTKPPAMAYCDYIS